MAGGSFDEDEITGINVTPLVDVMLVLLIIFMVTASYIVNPSINVKLPAAATGESAAVDDPLELVIDAGGQLFIDGQAVETTDVTSYLNLLREQGRNNIAVLIAADEKVPHGQVVQLIDLVRQNGVTDFAINVEAPIAKVPVDKP